MSIVASFMVVPQHGRKDKQNWHYKPQNRVPNWSVFYSQEVKASILLIHASNTGAKNMNPAHRDGLPPSMFFCHSSPREYASSQFFRACESRRCRQVKPSVRSATTTSSASNSFKRSVDCVETINCRRLETERSIAAKRWIAKGCKPSSGSSINVLFF